MTMKSIARWAVYLPLFAIPFIPLYIASGLFFPFITGKGFVFRILVETALAGYVFLALVDARYRPRFSWTMVAYLALTVWMAIADALAVNAHKAFWSNFERMDGWVTLVHMFAFFIILGSVLTVDKLWRKWWLFFLSGAALVCAYGLFQLSGMADIHQGGARVDSTFGNAAYLAVYLMFVSAISLWQAFESKGWMRYTLFAFTALSAFILFTTETRGAVIGLVGATGLGSILWMLEAGKKKARFIAGGVFLGLLVLVGTFFALKDSSFIKQDPTLARISSISLADGATRFTLWDMAVKGALERPVFGWGQEGFNYLFQEHYKPALFAQEPWFDRAHNTYIDWLVAGGIPALLLFLGLIASAVAGLYRKTASRTERIILVSAFAAYCFQALFVFDNLFSYIGLALLLAAAHAVSSKPWDALEKLPEVKEQMAHTVVAPIVIAIAIGAVWMVNVPSITQATKIVTALGQGGTDPDGALTLFTDAYKAPGLGRQEVSEQFINFASQIAPHSEIPAGTRTEIITEALRVMDEQVAQAPKDARLRVQYATGLRAVGMYDKSLEQSEIALSFSPMKQTILLERGFAYWEKGDLKSTRDVFRVMYELDPSFAELAQYAVAGEILMNNREAADAILVKAFGSTLVDSRIINIAYYQTKRYSDLIEALKRHLVTDPSTEAYLRLASAYVLSGHPQYARETAQEALARHPETASTITAFLAKIPQ